MTATSSSRAMAARRGRTWSARSAACRRTRGSRRWRRGTSIPAPCTRRSTCTRSATCSRTRSGRPTTARPGSPSSARGAPVRGYAHVIKEDLVNPRLLFLGTEFGLWVSLNGGQNWAQFKGGEFPQVAVRDLAIHPRDHDLVIATHGRGMWIVDDITPLRTLTPAVLSAKRPSSRGGRSSRRFRRLAAGPAATRHSSGPIHQPTPSSPITSRSGTSSGT